jgi:hypothetical protein
VRKNKNNEQNPKVELGFIPSKENPKTRFLDGLLVGAGSFKPKK